MIDAPMNEVPARGMKPKVNRKGDPNKVMGYDCAETPSYALDPLLRYISKDLCIWEPACGTGRLVRAFERAGYDVIGSDLSTGHNFFSTECDGAQVICSNPPYSLKPEFIYRCYEIGLPFALLLPVEVIGSQKVQMMMRSYGAELLLLDKRVNFYMPNKGIEGADGWKSSAQFPTMWYCWHLLPSLICYGEIVRYPEPEGEQ